MMPALGQLRAKSFREAAGLKAQAGDALVVREEPAWSTGEDGDAVAERLGGLRDVRGVREQRSRAACARRHYNHLL